MEQEAIVIHLDKIERIALQNALEKAVIRGREQIEKNDRDGFERGFLSTYLRIHEEIRNAE